MFNYVLAEKRSSTFLVAGAMQSAKTVLF